MEELEFFNLLLFSLLVAAIVVFIVLFFITAPYGQHIRKKWGPNINNKAGWIIMEIPTLVIYFFYWLYGDRPFEIMSLVFLCLWFLHYGQRTIIFPLLIRGKEPMPISIMLFGMIFNGFNTYLQARWINSFSAPYSIDWIFTPYFIIGIFVFFSGFIINLHSDHIIRNLRKSGEIGYKIPYGGLYKWVSCPNYLGEITEWTGWAIMTWSLPGLTFAVWTFANLAPRARSNHLWYQKMFPDYPTDRKALIPYIY